MAEQPRSRFAAIAFEPAASGTLAETVSPGIHIGDAAIQTESAQLSREQDLEIANRALFIVIAARVHVEARSPHGIHADKVREFVQHGVDRRIGPPKDLPACQAGFRRAPVRTRNRLTGSDRDSGQSITAGQFVDCLGREFGASNDRAFRLESRL